MAPDPDREKNAEERMDGLVSLYEKHLLRVCWLFLRDHAAAEDAVQETFLRAYRSLSSFQGISSEKTWLTAIAVNICRDARRNAWYRYVDRRVTIDQLPIAVPEPGIEKMNLTMEIMKLRPKYLEAVMLYYYEGCSMRETAVLLGISEAAVSGRLKKAREALKTALEGGRADEE